MADIALIPGHPGPNRVEIRLLEADLPPFAPVGIMLALSRPAEGLERIELRAIRGEDGIWRPGPVHLPPGGALDVVAEILITDFRKETSAARWRWCHDGGGTRRWQRAAVDRTVRFRKNC